MYIVFKIIGCILFFLGLILVITGIGSVGKDLRERNFDIASAIVAALFISFGSALLYCAKIMLV